MLLLFNYCFAFSLKAAQAEGEDNETVEGEEEKKDEIGVPNIIIDCSDKSKVPSAQLMDLDVLPNRAEVNIF